jgi:hypothetical protein
VTQASTDSTVVLYGLVIRQPKITIMVRRLFIENMDPCRGETAYFVTRGYGDNVAKEVEIKLSEGSVVTPNNPCSTPNTESRSIQ